MKRSIVAIHHHDGALIDNVRDQFKLFTSRRFGSMPTREAAVV